MAQGMRARETDPSHRMIMQGWLLALTNEGSQVARAKALVDDVAQAAADKAGLTNREAEHLAALRLAVNGQWPSAETLKNREMCDCRLRGALQS